MKNNAPKPGSFESGLFYIENSKELLYIGDDSYFTNVAGTRYTVADIEKCKTHLKKF